MSARVVEPAGSPRGAVEAARDKARLGDRWGGKLVLMGLSIALLSLSFAPFGQFYLAWVGLAPWLVLTARCGSQRSAFLWGWLAGTLFFFANMWWLVYVTGPGMIALMLLLGLYWALAAILIRGAGVLENSRRDRTSPPTLLPALLVVPVVWVALEWMRGNYPLNGLPWLFLGHAQTPVLLMCQIADLFGVYGVSFCVAMVNTLIALYVLRGGRVRPFAAAAACVAAVLVVVGAYGWFRMAQRTTFPGPQVMVVQPDYPQSNSGEKGASGEEMVRFHVATTEAALRRHPGTDLVVWSETMMPPLNSSARAAAAGSPAGELWEATNQSIARLARDYHTHLLVGGLFSDRWMPEADGWTAADRRNTAYFYEPSEGLAETRYDKIHLVPMGEYMPFKSALPLLYRLLMSLSPYTEEYTLTAGSEDALTVFQIKPAGGAASAARPWHFVTPICFEDIDPALVARMFRPRTESASGVNDSAGKRADLIVNITNDGWFKANEMPQHLQAAVFRSIENRAPTARSVNTGISGFIDSVGRTHGLVAAGTEGASVATLSLDSRTTLYTRVGDAFAIACAILTAALALGLFARARLARRARRDAASGLNSR